MRYFCLRYRWIVTTLGVLFATASAIAISAELGDMPNDTPEFYFTRLIYRQNPNGYFRPFTMANPGPYHCPEFGGKNFFPPQGWGWATDSPGADCKLMGAIHRLTGQHVYPNPNYMPIMICAYSTTPMPTLSSPAR